jgi:rhodanese-related sulfurtransferase
MFMALAAAARSGGKPAPDSELPAGSAGLIQPEALVKTLQSRGAKPVVLYVGPRFLYAQAHVPGAEFIGPASDPQSLETLRKRAAALKKNSHIVLYCGCCPWEHCPNVRPAFNELQKLGFTNIKALYLATSFGANWVEKGYPVEKGEAR